MTQMTYVATHVWKTVMWTKFIFTCFVISFGLSKLGKEIEFEKEKEADSVILENNSGTGRMTMLRFQKMHLWYEWYNVDISLYDVFLTNIIFVL